MDEFGDELQEEISHGIENMLNITSPNNTAPDDDVDGDFSNFFNDPFFNPSASPISDGSTCKRLLYATLSAGSNVRMWDLLILLPNLLFSIFLAAKFNAARQKLRATNAPIFRAFYGFVVISAGVSVVRSLVSMSISAATPIGDETDKLLWILLRFSLLATEMSVLVFGLGSGHLDSQRSIRRVISVTFIVSLAYSLTQAVLELSRPDPNFHVESRQINLFGHGGMMFWLLSSAFFTLVYLFVLLLPFLPCRHYVSLPHKRSFYQYVGFLMVLNGVQTAGSLMVYCNIGAGLCVVNLTTFLYFTTFTPIVYYTFLRGFFKVAQPQLLFSYKAQVDDFEEDMMHQSTSLQFNDVPPQDHATANNVLNREENSPIVLNSAAVFGNNAGNQDSTRNPPADLMNTGIASPDSVVNYNFGN